jgi:hypothetical protein
MEDNYEDVSRAAKAQQLMEDPILQEAFEILRQDYFQKWVGSTKPELREACWYLYQAVKRAPEHLEAVIRNGQLAQRAINEFEASLVHKRGKRAA